MCVNIPCTSEYSRKTKRLEVHYKAPADAKKLISKVCNVCAQCEQGAGKCFKGQ